MTVYDYCHLGHARALVVFDMVVRYLRWLGFEVNYIRNITDIEDKIIARAQQNNEPYGELTARFITAMNEDCAMLFVEPPNQEPRATEHIATIIALIKSLEERDLAYVGDHGDVYYSVRNFPTYGQLSGKDTVQQRDCARVAIEPDKRDPRDFVLWKRAKPDEPQWPSPWGAGRPGWHIECSAMSTHCLGNHFDIHAGGKDLIFPHHENEIAQSEGASGEKFVNLWMHNGHVKIDAEKMSKSLGNFLTIRELLGRDKIPQRMGEILRFLTLGSQYRSPLHYSDNALENAKTGLTRFYLTLQKLEQLQQVTTAGTDDIWIDRFKQCMNDDFNTPEAVSVLFELTREINRMLDLAQQTQAITLGQTLKQLGAVLGIFNLQPDIYLGKDDATDVKQIEALLAQRTTARQQKDWPLADQLRVQLDALGIVIEDRDGSTSWRRR